MGIILLCVFLNKKMEKRMEKEIKGVIINFDFEPFDLQQRKTN